MYRVFTNEVGMCFSWEGAKKKKAFKNLAIAPIILCKLLNNFYKNIFLIYYYISFQDRFCYKFGFTFTFNLR